ncbi:wall-associated receptor kinase-like protein [Trifolium medium]|uniref:Wall-associated receptor kinase-like protein n=1 Tax=Trifolium medium TaxID=97028 RepID=A0A392MEH9_9FABA|nr:wall-associated receptor kinase-like protein [Trifolium medium]
MTEVENLAKLSHQNLMVLHGCTSFRSEKLMLVYEYVGNGTVYDHLHGNEDKYVRLTWDNRMTIAVETASALRYLHASNIVHRDIKSRNILLTAELHVKLGDFGLARPFPEDQSRVETGPQGTLGYIDPEYRRESELTHKSDVFSFGVVLLELISSLRAFDYRRSDHHLSDKAKNKFENNALDQLLDRTLDFDSDPRVEEMMMGVAELAVRCVQDSKHARPSMDEVLVALQNIQNVGGNAPNAGQPEAVDNYNPDDDDEIVELLN